LNPEQCYSIINPQFKPFKHQRECWRLIQEEGAGFCLSSGTGSGKTESVGIPAIFLDKRLVMVYPTRSLIEDQVSRFEKYCMTLVEAKKVLSKTVAYDTGDMQYGKQIKSFEGKPSLERIKGRLRFRQRYQPGKIQIIGAGQKKRVDVNDIVPEIENIINSLPGFIIEVVYGQKRINVIPKEKRQIITETTKKHLYGADIILTTLDMFLYRFFGYGERKWNLLFPYRLYMGTQARKQLVICFDEAHLYDEVSFTNFMNLVGTFVGADIKVVVMSATLPKPLLDMLEKRYDLEVVNGMELSGEKSFRVIKSNNRKNEIVGLVKKSLEERIIIVRNTVKQAFGTYQKLKSISKNSLYLYHGRMFPKIRTRHYESLKKKDEKSEPYILVTTNAIEVGCDLNSTLLITDYCNPDQLLQRMGRCARKKDTKGKCILLGTNFQTDDSFLRLPEAYNYQTYQKLITAGDFTADEIRATITPHLRREELTDALFQFHYSYVYEFDVMRSELHDSGILATRSWTPSFKVFWVKEQTAFDTIEKFVGTKSVEEILKDILLHNRTPLRIPIDYCILHESEEAIDWKKVKMLPVTDSSSPVGYNRQTTINPYQTELYLFLFDNTFPNHNPKLGLIRLPHFFTVKRRGLITTLQASKRYFINSEWDRKIRYLDISKKSLSVL